MGKYAATALFSAVVTAVAVSAFWIWFYNTVPQGQPAVERSGNVVAVVPPRAAPVAVAEQVVVGSGLRRSKLLLPGAVLAALPGVEVIEGLGLPA